MRQRSRIKRNGMKKILVISSNPRRNDNSDTLRARFRAGAAEAGHEVAEVLLGDLRIDPCTGCGNCSVDGGVCPLQDDMAGLASRMSASELIVLDTTPRACAMGGPMKNFIDRCCACRHEIRAKEFYIILAAAEDDVKLMERTVDTFQGFFDCLEGATLKGVVYGTGAWKRGEIEGKPAMTEAWEMGRGC